MPGRISTTLVPTTCMVLFTLILTGCSSTPETITVDDREIKTLRALSVSCKKPYLLTQDCSRAAGASRKFRIGGVNVKLAASEDGRTLLLMNSRTTVLDTAKMNRASREIQKFAQQAGLTLESIEAVILTGEIEAYFFVYDGDIYSLLLASPHS